MRSSELTIHTFPVGQMQVNCYFVVDNKSSDAVIIDAGDDADFLIQKIEDNTLIPHCIIATHGHFDHIMAVTHMQLAYRIPFLVNRKDEFLVKSMSDSSFHFLKTQSGPAPTIHADIDGEKELKSGTLSFDIIPTPGHTPGSVCLYLPKNGILFCGDLLFAQGGVGRTDFSYSNKIDLDTSIHTILKLPGNTLVYPGHGQSFRLNDEIQFHNES